MTGDDTPPAAGAGYFDARASLAGELDDTTVRQAVGGGSRAVNPTPHGGEPTEEALL